jgi:hypothetical protein
VTLGGAVGASATLGGLDPSGNLEFALYGPEDPTCAGSPAYTASVAVSGAGTYEAPAFTPTAIGTYRWVVTYPGDGANLDAATACADPDAAVTVSAPPVQPEERKPEGPEAKKPEQHTAPPSPAPTPQVVIWHTPNSGHAPKGGGGKGDPRYTFIFTDPTGPVTFYCRLDGKPWKVCASPAVYRNLRRGKHVFRVKSVDAAGAQSAVQTVRFRAGRRPIR